jgi:hypothetical protein
MTNVTTTECDVFEYKFKRDPDPDEHTAGRDAVLAAGNRLCADGTDAGLVSYGLMSCAIDFFLRAHHSPPAPDATEFIKQFNTPAKRLAALHSLVDEYAEESPDFHAEHDEPATAAPADRGLKSNNSNEVERE